MTCPQPILKVCLFLLPVPAGVPQLQTRLNHVEQRIAARLAVRVDASNPSTNDYDSSYNRNVDVCVT